MWLNLSGTSKAELQSREPGSVVSEGDVLGKQGEGQNTERSASYITGGLKVGGDARVYTIADPRPRTFNQARQDQSITRGTGDTDWDRMGKAAILFSSLFFSFF